jgi:hypothetical protein
MNHVTSSTGSTAMQTTPFGDDRETYSRFNQTELYQMCRRVGLIVPPNASKNELIEYYLGRAVPPEFVHPVDSLRWGLVHLVREFYRRLETQLDCPAKVLGTPIAPGDPDVDDLIHPKACFTCEDAKVLSCVNENDGQEKLIQLRRKDVVRTYPEIDMSNAIISIADASRNPAELAKLPRFQIRALAEQLGRFADMKEKTAFLDMNTAQQAPILAQWLAEVDRGGGGGGAVPQGGGGGGMQQQGGMMGGATQGGGAGLPQMPGGGGGGFGVGMQAQNLPGVGLGNGMMGSGGYTQAGAGAGQASGGPGNAEVLNAINTLAVSTNGVLGNVIQGIQALQSSRTNDDPQLRQAIAGLTDMVKMSIGCTLVVAENQLGMPPKMVLEQAAEMVGRFLSGKG